MLNFLFDFTIKLERNGLFALLQKSVIITKSNFYKMKITYTDNKEYVLKSDDDIFLGSLKFEGWTSSKAHFTTQYGEFYDIKTKGFWGTSIAVSKGNFDFAELKLSWKGHIVIDLVGNEEDVDYILKLSSIWKSKYTLQNRNGSDLMMITAEFRWNGYYDFKIEINPDFANDVDETLILMSAYGVIYLIMMSAAAAS